jgi:hypothetical protein
MVRAVRRRGILLVALVAAVLLPAAASAKPAHHRLRLALVPLQTAQLGPAGASLPIAFDSGRVSDAEAGSLLKKLGRVDGYLLDYGDPFTGGTGVTSIETQVERYRTPKGARKALGYWKQIDLLQALVYREIGISVGAHVFKTPSVGSAHFAYLMPLRIPNADPVYTVDEVATSGGFVLHATTYAGTASAAERLAPVLTSRLVHRLHRLLGGQLHATPAKLPHLPVAGPPPGGPDLSQLVVGPADFTGPATVIDQGYEVDPSAISSYAIGLQPAGPFAALQDSITWYANANEATWSGTLIGDILTAGGSGSGTTVVDVSTVGDNAHAAILSGQDQSGAPIAFAFVSMWRGQAVEIALAQGPTTMQPSEVQALAQAMATHFDAGLGGLPWKARQMSGGVPVTGASGIGLDFGLPSPWDGTIAPAELQSVARAMPTPARRFFVR